MLLEDKYLRLLKESLTDYIHVDNVHANALPLAHTMPKGALKNIRNNLIFRLASRSHLLVSKVNRLSESEIRHNRENGLDWPPFAFTMVGLKRLDNLEALIREVVKNGIEGDLLEAGSWRGGSAIFMQAMLELLGVDNRKLWVCDSFEGLPPPSPEKYPEDHGDIHHTFSILAVSEQSVRSNFKRFNLLGNNVQFVKGYFKDTLPLLDINKLSLLRLDGDMYESNMDTLEPLYNKVSAGGFIVIDDYGLPPCKKAVEVFRKQNNIEDEIVDIDGTAVYWRKSK